MFDYTDANPVTLSTDLGWLHLVRSKRDADLVDVYRITGKESETRLIGHISGRLPSFSMILDCLTEMEHAKLKHCIDEILDIRNIVKASETLDAYSVGLAHSTAITPEAVEALKASAAILRGVVKQEAHKLRLFAPAPLRRVALSDEPPAYTDADAPAWLDEENIDYCIEEPADELEAPAQVAPPWLEKVKAAFGGRHE